VQAHERQTVTSSARDPKDVVAVYVDMGTTNTRVWLTCGDPVVAHATELIGIRDSARDDGRAIRNALRELIARVRHEAQQHGEVCTPNYIVAAGMIGSNLGLEEVPHVQAPAGIDELAAAARWCRFMEVSDLPFLLVPGVRSGSANATVESMLQIDVMRGEETLCAGLLALGIIEPPATVLNLGSHWKAIELDRGGRIRSSVTTLSGELLHAVQTHTVLVGSLARERPERLSSRWVEAGMKEQRRSGLARALFCVRSLDLAHEGSPEDRLAFAVGVFIAADLHAFLARSVIGSQHTVALVGHSAISEAWQTALSQNKIAATLISKKQAETALLEALRRILVGALPALDNIQMETSAASTIVPARKEI